MVLYILNIAMCKVGLRSHKMTQITEYKPLEDGDSEYYASSCPQKDNNHKAYFLMLTWVNVENWIFVSFLDFFAPIGAFYTPKITN